MFKFSSCRREAYGRPDFAGRRLNLGGKNTIQAEAGDRLGIFTPGGVGGVWEE